MRVLLIVVCIVIVVSAAVWVTARVHQNRAAAEPWADGLGPLNDVPKRFPKHGATPAAEELARLAAPLGVDLRVPRPRDVNFDGLREPITKYLKRVIERTDGEIEAPPDAVAQYLAVHGEELTAVRRRLLAAGPIAFPVDLSQKDPPVPNLLSHIQLFRLLDADALERARRGELVAWDDLEASWRLSQSLLARPEQISQLVGLTGMRLANAVARKMPLPAPYWLAEVEAFDVRRSFLAAMQAESWSMWHSTERFGLFGPFETQLIGQRRWITAQLAAESRCAFDGVAFAAAAVERVPSWNPLRRFDFAVSTVWKRLFRTHAELELTGRALAARSGGPPNPKSRCSDGQWLYEQRPDGAVAIRFSRPLPQPQDGRVIHYPAEFVVTPAPAR